MAPSTTRPFLTKRCHVCGYRYESTLEECPADHVPLDRAQAGVDYLGPYRLVERLAVGGMGAVYRAINEKIGRAVAVKLLHQSLRGEVVSVSRFFTEARAVNSIRHPNVVEVYDFSGEGEDVFMVLELLHGQDLRSVLGSQPFGYLPPVRVVSILEQVCGALQATHARKIVHRDLKPENVFLLSRDPNADRDMVKLLDFGVAKLERPEGKLTREGIALGTPEYMAPEQARAIHVDGRTDVYAVGCIAFEMLTGRTVFHGASPGDVMIKQVREAPPSPRDFNPAIPPALEQVVLRCLAKAPKDRPQSAMDLARELCTAVGVPFDRSGAFENWRSWDGPTGSSLIEMPAVEVSARAAGKPATEPKFKWVRRRQMAMAGAAVAALGLMTFVALQAGRRGRPQLARAADGPTALTARPASVAVTVRSQPAAAEVFDQTGQRLGTTPLRLELPAGLELSLRFVRPGFTTVVRDLKADDNSPELQVTLEPERPRAAAHARPARGRNR
jgi:serine/threonine protein kinase